MDGVILLKKIILKKSEIELFINICSESGLPHLCGRPLESCPHQSVCQQYFSLYHIQIVQMFITLCYLNFTVFVQPCERVNQIGIQQLSVMGLLTTMCVMF